MLLSDVSPNCCLRESLIFAENAAILVTHTIKYPTCVQTDVLVVLLFTLSNKSVTFLWLKQFGGWKCAQQLWHSAQRWCWWEVGCIRENMQICDYLRPMDNFLSLQKFVHVCNKKVKNQGIKTPSWFVIRKFQRHLPEYLCNRSNLQSRNRPYHNATYLAIMVNWYARGYGHF